MTSQLTFERVVPDQVLAWERQDSRDHPAAPLLEKARGPETGEGQMACS
jgi:hypothetical protein